MRVSREPSLERASFGCQDGVTFDDYRTVLTTVKKVNICASGYNPVRTYALLYDTQISSVYLSSGNLEYAVPQINHLVSLALLCSFRIISHRSNTSIDQSIDQTLSSGSNQYCTIILNNKLIRIQDQDQDNALPRPCASVVSAFDDKATTVC